MICTYLAHNCVIWHCQLQSRNHICSSDFFEYLLIWRMGPDNDRTWRQTFSNCKREDQWYASVKRYPFPTNSDKGIHSWRSLISKYYESKWDIFSIYVFIIQLQKRRSWLVERYPLPTNSDKLHERYLYKSYSSISTLDIR